MEKDWTEAFTMGLLNNAGLVIILKTNNLFNGMFTIPWDSMDKTGKMVKKFIVIPISFLPLEKSCHCSHMYQITYQVSNFFTLLFMQLQKLLSSCQKRLMIPFQLYLLYCSLCKTHLHHGSGNSLIPLLDAPKNLSPVSKPPPLPQSTAFIASLTCEGGPNEVGNAL